MARKSRGSDLAGLAALGALGYMLSKGSKAAPTGGGGGSGSRMPAAASEAGPSIDDDMRKRAVAEGEKVSEGERVSRFKTDRYIYDDAGDGGSSKPVGNTGTRPTAATAPSAATGFKKNPGAVSPSPGNQRGPTAEELASYNAIRRKNPGTGNQRGPTAEELEAYAASRSTPATKPSLDIPEMQQRAQKALADDPAALAGPATGLGVAGYRVYKYGKSAYDAAKAAKAAERTAAAGREAVTNPLSWMAGPKNAGKFSGEVPAAGREAVTNPMSWMAGPKGMKQFEEAAPSMTSKAMDAAERLAARFRKKPLSEADTAGGAIGYKRGGSVKPKKMASGGMARSGASKRADGIATKGKTRGKIC